jgi:hypothetical protein
MSRIKPPAFLDDLYRDLRGRRLLIPAVALVVALVAVPVLLANGQPSVAPPAPAPPTEATAAQPAVLAEQVGIRDYSKRLEALKSKNPFKQQFALPTPESVAIADAPSATPVDSAAPADLSTGASASSSVPSSTPVVPVPSASGTGSTPTDQVNHTRRLITRVVDVTLGPLGDTKQYDNVRRTDVLPSNDDPIVAFFGASPNGKRASFLLSAGVVYSDGDGSCAPAPDSCYFLTLKEGQQRYLHIQPEGEEEEAEEEPVIYRFKLKRIEEKVVKGSREAE